ncbi:efflux RND transporter permease subunit [Streptomyces sp. MNU76]|uniref:MMPL family transporter n=1 Tax=Streptomyces sp. MNU76 TaxID=2560026 RepID=UPI001E3C2B1F|nr:efflux RND transporter permease subunit [Streptomyces sp. MNU76]MCC9706042.1 efflux RND transporter permease subunit [Streptomyces sp. MNU76]
MRTLWAAVLCAVAVVCVAALGVTAALSTGGFNSVGTESAHAEGLLRKFRGADPGLVLRVRSEGSVDSARARSDGAALARRVAAEPGVAAVEAYWTSRSPALRAHDGRSALIGVALKGDEAAQRQAASRIVPQVTGRQGLLRVSPGGRVWGGIQAAEQGERDLVRAELVVAPVVFVCLVFAFGSWLAALFPLLVGALAVAGAWAFLRLLGGVMEVSAISLNIATALGFGLAVDYALLVVTRFREEGARGLAVPDAAVEAARTAGRSVLVSAGVVALAFSALWVFPFPWLRSMAVAGIAVVLLAATASVVLLPALLAMLGSRIGHSGAASSPAWRRLARWVTRAPWSWAACCAVLMAVLVWPFGQAQWGFADERALPAGSQAREFTERLRTDFPAQPDRDLIVVLTPAPGDREVDRYARRISALPGVVQVTAPTGRYRTEAAQTGPNSTKSMWLKASTGLDPQSAAAARLVERVRELPAPGPRWVGGSPARHVDAKTALADRVPYAVLLMAATTLVALLLYTRSVLIPLKAVAMAALSLTASLGSMIYIFQEGHLRWLVGDFTTTGFLDMTIPPLLCAIAFALSLDYEVFLLARVKEHYDAWGDHREAIVEGIARTGRLITVAAGVFAISMAGLASSGITTLKMMGVGLGVAVLIDATLVRGILVPAFMQLTGRANWWAPVWVKRPSAQAAKESRHGQDMVAESSAEAPAAH